MPMLAGAIRSAHNDLATQADADNLSRPRRHVIGSVEVEKLVIPEATIHRKNYPYDVAKNSKGMLVREFEENLYVAAPVKDRLSIYLHGLKPASDFNIVQNMLDVPALIASQSRAGAIAMARQKYGEDSFDIYELHSNGFTGASLESNYVDGRLSPDQLLKINKNHNRMLVQSEIHIDAEAGRPELIAMVKAGGAQSKHVVPGSILAMDGMLQTSFSGYLYIPVSAMHSYRVGSDYLAESTVNFLRCSETEEGGMAYGKENFGKNNFMLYKIKANSNLGIFWYQNYLFNQKNTAEKLGINPENLFDTSTLSKRDRHFFEYRMVDLRAKIDKKDWEKIFDPGQKLAEIDTSISKRLAAAQKEIEDIAALYDPILNPLYFIENYIKSEILEYEKITGKNTELLPESKIKISYCRSDAIVIDQSGPSRIPHPKPVPEISYSMIDIITGQYLRDLNSLHGPAGYLILGFEHEKLIKKLTEIDLQNTMLDQLSNYFSISKNVEGIKKYHVDMIRLRCLQYLDNKNISGSGKRAVEEFLAGKIHAKEVFFHEIKLNGVFLVPVKNGGILFSVNDKKYFEALEKNINVYISGNFVEISIPGFPESDEFRSWILNKIPYYYQDKYRNNPSLFSAKVVNVEIHNDGPFWGSNFPIRQDTQLPFTLSKPQELGKLIDGIVFSEKDRLSKDIDYLIRTPKEQLIHVFSDITRDVLGFAALVAGFAITGGSTSAAWSRIMIPLAIDAASVVNSLLQAASADRISRVEECQAEALMAGALGIMGLGIGVKLDAKLLKQGVSVSKALKLFRQQKSGFNNRQKWFMSPTRLDDGRIGYPLSPQRPPALGVEPDSAKAVLPVGGADDAANIPWGQGKLVDEIKTGKIAENGRMQIDHDAKQGAPHLAPLNGAVTAVDVFKPRPAGIIQGVEVIIPMDGVEMFVERNIIKYRVKNVDGDVIIVKYDSDKGGWHRVFIDRSVSTDFILIKKTDNSYQCKIVSEKEFSSAKKNGFAEPVKFRKVNFGRIPKVPVNPRSIPKKIHSVWIGDDISLELSENIINNAKNSGGYEYTLFVDANEGKLKNIEKMINNKVSNLKVVDLNKEDFFKKFKGDDTYRMYEFFRSGRTQNLAACSDVLRYKVLNEFGGTYLDADDSIVKFVGNVDLKAKKNDILLNRSIGHQGTNFFGFGNSNIACHPDNKMLDEIIGEMIVRFDENRNWLFKNRPRVNFFSKKEDVIKFHEYQKKIFHITGPDLLTDVIKKKNTGSGYMANLEMEVEINNIILPKEFEAAKINAENYYFPFHKRFPIKIGSQNSMRQVR